MACFIVLIRFYRFTPIKNITVQKVFRLWLQMKYHFKANVVNCHCNQLTFREIVNYNDIKLHKLQQVPYVPVFPAVPGSWIEILYIDPYPAPGAGIEIYM